VGHHILIVDSNPRLRDLLREMLTEERADDKIETASSGREALVTMRRERADILIADWQMPDMDGMTLVELTKALYPNTHAILLTTADQDEVQERRHHRQISFTSFTKPFSIETFLGHIDQVLTQIAQPTVAHSKAIEDQSNLYESSKSALRPALGWS
jgi:DNA-binding response OmpR family regulator